MKEQMYLFVDKTIKGEKFTKLVDAVRKTGNPILASIIYNKKEIGCGDMLAFRDELTDMGFEWGTDFYIKKVNP